MFIIDKSGVHEEGHVEIDHVDGHLRRGVVSIWQPTDEFSHAHG